MRLVAENQGFSIVMTTEKYVALAAEKQLDWNRFAVPSIG
jgi:hypothetical protein